VFELGSAVGNEREQVVGVLLNSDGVCWC
jgi:hypothetical protein